jgi:GNAT superfamily N-acetyltransferase
MAKIDATAALLESVFPDAPRISRTEYLRWLYEDSPFGEVIEANLDDSEGRAGHYAVVPADLTEDGAGCAGALSLNTAVDERARGGGVFVRLAEETFEQARERGVGIVLGVANENSTPGFVRRLSFELVGPLPATVMVPAPGGRRSVRSAWADDAAFATGGVAADGLEALLAPPQRGIARRWTPETLRWRLASPGSRYALHRSERMLVVTTADRGRAVPVAVLLKAFASAPPSAAERRAVVRAACRFHRAPVAIHAGFNDMVAFRGMPLPERLRPAPLNLIARRLEGERRAGVVTRFEFLDFDAY